MRLFSNTSELSCKNPAPTYYVWGVRGIPLSIQINLEVVDRLAQLVSEASSSGSGRPVEVGGIFLGRVDTSEPEYPRTVIEDFKPVTSEYARGDCYVLSIKDKQTLGRRIARLQSAAGNDLTVVGYYRSHLRSGLYLTEDDFSMIRIYFSDPSSVFLLIKAASGKDMTGGFFFWEEEDIHRHFSFLEFPFDRAQLETENVHMVLPAGMMEQPERTVEHESSSNAYDELSHEASASDWELAAPRTEFPSEPRAIDQIGPVETSSFVAQPIEGCASPGLKGWLWIPIAAAVLIAVLMFSYRMTAEHSIPISQPAFRPLAFNVERNGASLRLSWNHDDAAVKEGSSGVLWITDGNKQQKLALEKLQLTTGSFLYWPASTNVNFRLEIVGPRRVTESILTLMGAKPPAPPSIAPVSSAILAQLDSPQAGPSTAAVPSTNKKTAHGRRARAGRKMHKRR